MRHLVWIAAAVAVAGCGASEGGRSGSDRLERYGISLKVPDGWHGEIKRGTIRLGTAPRAAKLGAADVAVTLYEYEVAEPESAASAAATYSAAWPPRFEKADLTDADTAGAIDAANAPGRRAVAVNGRFFNVFLAAGSRSATTARLDALNAALARIDVRPGDFYPGQAESVAFPERPGWDVVSSGASPRYAQGEYAQTAAATVPYRNGPADLPPARTLEALPRDGILIWVGLSRDARFPPASWPEGSAFERRGPPPYALADLVRVDGWEGQVRDIPEYRVWAAYSDQYLVDLRVYFGRSDPTPAMLAEADAVLRALRFPDWGPWELDER